MDLNYYAFFAIAFLPLIIGYFWYRPMGRIALWADEVVQDLSSISVKQMLLLYLASLGLVYAYMNLIIHQLGFYELFFTDIMLGKDSANDIVADFLATYGSKHRHFGHGILHGAINAFLIALPLTLVQAILYNKGLRYFMFHFSYWLLTSVIVGGLISEFI